MVKPHTSDIRIHTYEHTSTYKWNTDDIRVICGWHTSKCFNVARVVNLKLAFIERFFYNLVILIKLCKVRYLHLHKAPLFPRNQVICLKNWKLWQAPTTIKFNILCWNFAHVSYLTMSTKRYSGFFLFINRNVKKECVETRYFVIFANNWRSKQNKKIPNTLF